MITVAATERTVHEWHGKTLVVEYYERPERPGRILLTFTLDGVYQQSLSGSWASWAEADEYVTQVLAR